MSQRPREYGRFTVFLGEQVWEVGWDQSRVQIHRLAVGVDPSHPNRPPRLVRLGQDMDLSAERPIGSATTTGPPTWAPWVILSAHEYFPRWATPLDVARDDAGLPLIVEPVR